MKKYKQGDLDEVNTKPVRTADNMPAVEEGGKNEDAPKVKSNMVDKSVFSKADERDY
jgi:hypothetical protein|tara:strand:- start:597 stop:767 length:171 start_codon:yes stop_codon:yes gene_type:complete